MLIKFFLNMKIKITFNKSEIKELFFPVFSDFNSINCEIDKKLISTNNWELANNNILFNNVITKIDALKKQKPKDNQTDLENIKSVIL